MVDGASDPSDIVPIAVSVMLRPCSTEGFTGKIVSDWSTGGGGEITVSSCVALMEPTLAVMVVVPGSTPRTEIDSAVPAGTVAYSGCEEDQTTFASTVEGASVPSDILPVTVSVMARPCSTEGFAGEIVSDWISAAMTPKLPESLFDISPSSSVTKTWKERVPSVSVGIVIGISIVPDVIPSTPERGLVLLGIRVPPLS